jgi:alpha-L-fucosidase
MKISRRSALGLLGAAGATPLLRAQTQNQVDVKIASGPFAARGTSLQAYSAPEWYRDAKFGMWAHWGPQSAPEMGDWYARNMYIQGSHQYEYHLKTYGHPSKFGYKDVIPLWKGENLDPNYLVGLYKKAGARYFCSAGVHCDNFDMWNSTHHRWNAAQMGIKKDVVGLFCDAARDHGLKFGVTEHVWGSWNWFAVNKGSDKQGPYAGVPYDGNDPANWDLYHEPHPITAIPWAEQGNEPVAWKREWLIRIMDLVDKYQPDLLYTDGAIPFGDWGRSLVAHYFNQSLRWHRGNMEVVYTCKKASDCAIGTCVLDVERGVFDGHAVEPWQSDTCIGDWFYNREVEYKTPKRVIDMLVDIVSRNGNLVLNIPLRPDGTPDSKELAIVEEITKWMAVNSEGIYATRPWKIYGAGPSTLTAGTHEFTDTGGFNEGTRKDMTADDVRFTLRGSTLYAFVMGWPQDFALIKPLAFNSPQQPGKIQNVELLGYDAKLRWKQDENGLRVDMPFEKPSDYAITLKIALA